MTDEFEIIGTTLIKCRSSKITRAAIPWGITKIDDYAFENCDSLVFVAIPGTVKTIGWGAFSGCWDLKSIIIPASVTSIFPDAFSFCDSLSSIVVESDNQYYDSRNNCNAIIETSTNTLIKGCSSTIIPNTVKTICRGAFEGCRLKRVMVPASLKSIDYFAFSSESTVEIVVDENNKTFDSRNNCNAIIKTSTNTLIKGCSSTIIPNTVKTIGEYAFFASYGLKTIVIPDSVTKIKDGAFQDCESLKTIIIPESVKTIGDYAFDGCDDLEVIYCRAKTAPSGWSKDWNRSRVPVVWDFKG